MARDLFDQLDLKIIDALAEDGRRPFTDVARDLAVAEATVRARVGRLQRLGAIRFVADKFFFQNSGDKVRVLS